MNKVYKTIQDHLTGRTVAAPECARSRGKTGRLGPSARIRPRHSLSRLPHASAALAMALAVSGAFAQIQTYDGSATQLETAGALALQGWTNLASTDQGVIYRDSGNSPVTTGANLIIDYASGTNPLFVIGGYSKEGTEATGNTVAMTRGNVQGSVYGGLSHKTAIAENNDQSSNHSAVGSTTTTSADVHGAGANASINKVAVSGNSSAAGSLYGGYAALRAQAGDATGGTGITASANTQASAETSTARADGNVLSVDGSAAVADLYGGHASITALAGKAIAGEMSSAWGFVDAHAASFAHAYASQASANGNTVIVNGGVSAGSLYGGHASITAHAAEVLAGEAASTGTSPQVSAFAGALAYADMSTINANGNTITVNGGASVGNLHGGYASLDASAGNATAGTATLATTSIAYAYASADALADESKISADSNVVSVTEGALVTGSIHGGYASLDVSAGKAAGGTVVGSNVPDVFSAQAEADVSDTRISASGNTVTLDGRLQGGSIYGGYARFYVNQGSATVSPGGASIGATAQAPVYWRDSEALATNNTVTISDHATISESGTSLYGGFLAYNTDEGHKPARYDVFTGNTLNFSAQPVTVHTVANFEKFNFTLQPALANQPTALISAQNIVLGTNADNLDASQTAKTSTIEVVGIHSGKVLTAGDRFVLMRADKLSGNGTGLTSTGVAQQGISLLYDVKTAVDLSGNVVTAQILDCKTATGAVCSDGSSGSGSNNGPAAQVNPQLKALSEGYLAGSMLVTRGADRIAGEAFDAIRVQNQGQGLSPFALASGGHTRYDSGSHIKSNDYFLAAGISYRQEQFTAGAFLEGGWGSYDSYNSFYNAATVEGDGNTRYYGAGLLGRYAFGNGFYTDASLRFGRNRIRFDTDDLQSLATGQFTRYSLRSRYVSAHLGVGYELPLTASRTLDLSAKYLGSSVDGKEVTVAGDPIHFERVDSRRLRLNAELAHHYSPTLTLKAGLGYEHEFDGKAKATTYDHYRIEAPSVRGGTGLLSLGASVQPTASRNLTLDFVATGYAGQRDGIGASMLMQYRF